MAWMATWWLTEAIDAAATALLPAALLPLITIAEHDSATDAIAAATAPYANRFIALFLGGFMLSLAMERWELHKRVALRAVSLVGTRPPAIVGGFMGVTACMSMWVSNTATAVVMLPVALSVVALFDGPKPDDAARAHSGRDNFALCLLLGIAYAASIGGIGTLIGTPPNLLLAGFLDTRYGVSISFARWMGVGLPLVVVFVPIAWIILTRLVYPPESAPIDGGAEAIRSRLRELGGLSRGEAIVLAVFTVTALCWVFRPLIVRMTIAGATPLAGLTDAGIALLATMALFCIPVRLRRGEFVMDWETAKRPAVGRADPLRGRAEPRGGRHGLRRGRVHRPPRRRPGRGAGCAGRPRRRRRGHLPHRADVQHGDDGRAAADPRRAGALVRDEPDRAARSRGDRRELRLHDAGRDAAQRDRLRGPAA